MHVAVTGAGAIIHCAALSVDDTSGKTGRNR